MNPDAEIIFRRFRTKAKFRHFSLLVELHDLRNMKRAAKVLGLSQPAVSLAVSELEKLLGVKLFLRHARGVEPTQVASDLVPIARRIMAALGDGSQIVFNSLSGASGFVRINATPAAMSAMLLPIVGDLARNYPNVHLNITQVQASDPLETIAHGTCDVLCLRELESKPENWQFEKVLSDALVVVCHKNNALAKHGKASLEDLQSSRWVLTRRGSIARERFEELSKQMQLPDVQRCGIVTHVPLLTEELLAQQNYLALLPRSVALPWLRSGSVVELESLATTKLAPLGFLWQREKATQVVRKLASTLMSL